MNNKEVMQRALEALVAEQADPKLRYDGLHEYAAQHRLNYNDLCRVVRAAMAEQDHPLKLAENMAEQIKIVVYQYHEAMPLATAIGVLEIVKIELIQEHAENNDE